MKFNRPIGLHIRYKDSILEALEKALKLKISVFQLFISKKSDPYLFLSLREEEIERFFKASCSSFEKVVIHSSYWTDLASGSNYGKDIFLKELEIAKKLGCTHFVIHSGSSKKFATKSTGIVNLARTLNGVLPKDLGFQIVIENTAFGNYYIGSDFQDFNQLLDLLDYPERVKFCLDTAHAYAYGYDFTSPIKMRSFLAFVDSMIGLDNICLIHLNNTNEELGSMHDHHSLLEEGNIPKKILKELVCYPKLCDVPIIMELPVVSEEKEILTIQEVCDWDNKCGGSIDD